MYPSAAPYERYPLQVSESRQNLVHLPLVYGTAKIIDDETRDATGKLRFLPSSTLYTSISFIGLSVGTTGERQHVPLKGILSIRRW